MQKKNYMTLDVSDKDRAVCFYIINKCSFSGLTESSSFSEQASDANFSMRGIDKLPVYSKLIKNWYITNVDYKVLLGDKEKTFVYLDPPYDIKDNLYGKKGSMHKKFDHDDFAKNCEIYNSEMLISYNSDQLVKDRFKDWNCAEFDLTYTMRSVGEYMRNQKTRKELLLFNYNTRSFLMDDRPSDMYQDMKKLNMLYEEMCWDNDDILSFILTMKVILLSSEIKLWMRK